MGPRLRPDSSSQNPAARHSYQRWQQIVHAHWCTDKEAHRKQMSRTCCDAIKCIFSCEATVAMFNPATTTLLRADQREQGFVQICSQQIGQWKSCLWRENKKSHACVTFDRIHTHRQNCAAPIEFLHRDGFCFANECVSAEWRSLFWGAGRIGSELVKALIIWLHKFIDLLLQVCPCAGHWKKMKTKQELFFDCTNCRLPHTQR